MFDKKIRNFEDYLIKRDSYRFLNENNNLDKEQERDARIKVNRSIIWININRGFFGRLLGNLSIYGSSDLDPKTMCTNGLSITYHPEFVLKQSRGAVNFVLCHEILHCVADHMGRRGTRDPLLWNYACDYAINPILDAEVVTRDFEWPVNEDGSRMGLYEKKYEGMRAEDIYEDLVKNGTPSSLSPQSGFGNIVDSDADLPAPDSEDSIVQDMTEDSEDLGAGDDADGKGAGEKGEAKDSDEGSSGNNILGKKVTVISGPYSGKTGIVKSVLPNGDIII